MNTVNWDVLIPLICYFVGVYILGFYSLRIVSRAVRREGTGFLAEYLTGDRNLGGFVLAMTLVATYLSAGSFIGGPGAAYSIGLAWVFLAMSQMPTGYFTLSVLGKKFAIVARKINAVTVTDFLNMELCTQLQDDLSIPVVYISTAELTQGQGIGIDFVGALGVGFSQRVKEVLDLNICEGHGGNRPKQEIKNDSFISKIPLLWFPVIAGMGAAIVIALVFAGFEATMMLKKSSVNTAMQKLGALPEVPIEEITRKGDIEKKKNIALKSLSTHTDQALLLTRLTALLPKGIVFESIETVFQEVIQTSADRGSRTKKLDYAKLEKKRVLKIVAYAYLKNSNEEVKRINEFVSALKKDDFFSKTFTEIKLGALKVNSKRDHQLTTFMLECQ